MSDTIYLNLREVADEWAECIVEMSSSVPDTEGMSWGELSDATTAFLAEPEQLEFVAKYTQLCAELGLEPREPATLRWYADRTGPTIVREDRFTSYAQDYAEEIGAISDGWPFSYVDWERAADAIRADFRTISYDGHDWLVRP